MADPFPFSQADWDRVGKAALPCLNATLAGDRALVKSTEKVLRELLRELRRKYGDHPVLLETEADFTENKRRKRALYEQAIQSALAGGLDTYTIRISFATHLAWDHDDQEQGRQQLLACQQELARADDGDRDGWKFAMSQCCAEEECES